VINLFLQYGLRVWYGACAAGLALTALLIVLDVRRVRRDGESLR
jgi:hypothetical protein